MRRLKLIAGGPKTGKTTAAGASAVHTDDMGTNREDFSKRVQALAKQLPWARGTIEGVIVPHALREALKDPHQRFDDVEVEFLKAPKAPTTIGQQTMAKGIHTVWDAIKLDLAFRGARVSER